MDAFLHPDQKSIVEATYPDRPVILRGVSGSGKTVVLIHRARALARKYKGENIGIITLNRDLAKLIENLLAKLCVDGEEKFIKVQAYYDYFKEVIDFFGPEKYLDEMINQTSEENSGLLNILSLAKQTKGSLINERCERSGETLEDTWTEFWNDEIEKYPNYSRVKRILTRDLRANFDVAGYIKDEFDLIRSAFPLKHRDSHEELGYFEYSRKGRGVPFNLGIREHIIKLLSKYEEYMLAGCLMDPLGLTQVVFPILSSLDELPTELKRRCLLVDEFQDFSTLELRFLKRIPPNKENALFLAGDLVQKVLVKDFDLSKAYLSRNDIKSETIRKNYRNSKQILQAANELAVSYSNAAKSSDSEFEVLDPEYAVRETAMPIALSSKDPISTAWNVVLSWLKGEIDFCSICIVSSNTRIYPLEKIIEYCPNNLSSRTLDGDYIKRKNTINVSTLSNVKGFEFGMIVIVGAEEDAIPDSAYPEEEHWREALRLYVAMTRGRDQVVFTYKNKPSKLLSSMGDFISWEIDSNYLAQE